MNPGYYSGLDHSGVVATYAPPAANSEDPPPPYVPRTTAVPDPRTLTPPLTQRQLHPATLFEANLVAHGLEGPLSPFADPESDAVSEISNLERDEGRGRQRDVDELSLVSAPDHERHGEPHQIV
ncbi:MAG: hypothetical protein M1830_000363 [Pleopsidium flavum]|nr:MAG: hypothetical protein M1830_000363 [Pleopsidium flavum]